MDIFQNLRSYVIVKEKHLENTVEKKKEKSISSSNWNWGLYSKSPFNEWVEQLELESDLGLLQHPR